MSRSSIKPSKPYREGEDEMTEIIKRVDWLQTPVGSMQNWPRNLVFALDSILHSGFPMFLFWGKEHTCFYNDACRLILDWDGKKATAPGKPGKEVWPEMWQTLQPMIDETLAGHKTRLLENIPIPVLRNGKQEPAYWTFSYSRIKDDAGTIQGVQVTFNETTNKVLLQKEAEEATHQLQFALEAADLGTWDLNPETMQFVCNQKTKEIFGLPLNETVDLDLAINAVHKDDINRVKQAIDRALDRSSGGGYDIEYAVIHPGSGEQKMVKAKGKALFNANGKPFRFSGTIQDITSDKLAKRRKEKLQQLVENSKDYMGIANLEGHLIYLNQAGRALLGIDPGADPATFSTKDFYNEPEAGLLQNEIVPSLKTDGHWTGFIKIKHQKTGEEIPCQGNYILIKDPLTKHIIARGLTLRDLRPELSARKELEDSEKRFRNLVQEAPVATAIYTGREMTIQWANDAMISLWGKDASVIGSTVRKALPELEGQPFHHLLDQVYSTGQMYQATEDRGDLVVDGVLKTFYFNFSYKPLRNADGKVYGILNMAIDVTEQVKVKRKLEESEKNFRSLIMQAPVGLCLLKGDDFLVEVANDQYLMLVARKRNAFVQRPLWEVLPEAKDQGFDRLLKEVKTTGKTYFGNEQPVDLLRNGRMETVYVNFVYEPLFDESGNVHSILVIAIDISQQVEARRKIENAEERARLAIESASMGTYEVNLLTKEVFPSSRFSDLFDLESSAEHEQYISKIHPDDQETRIKAHQKAMETGLLEYECRVIKKDGTTHWVHIVGQVYFEEPHRPCKIIGMVQDTTRQKLADEEREKFLSLSHYSRDFIGMCDMNMRTLYINKAGIEMLGIEGDIRNASLWNCFFPEDHAYLRNEFFPAVIEEGHGEVEIRFRHFQTAAPVWVIYSVFLIRDSRGEPSVMATVSRDITERKNMEQELEKRVQERTEELTKLNQELQQFTYVSSHDLKEPLRKIQFFASMAQEEAARTNNQLSVKLNKITVAANRMSNLLTDLLNYSFLSHTDNHFQEIDLNEVIRNIEEDSELLIIESQATLVKSQLPVVEGIPFQIGQLFFNLLNNALKFTRPGVPPVITIEASLLTEEERLAFPSLLPGINYHKISVTDNGIGFKQEYAQKIFVVFQRLNNRESFSGNGIGLSLCKKIVENHRGIIYARSTVGVGSVFTVILPAQKTA